MDILNKALPELDPEEVERLGKKTLPLLTDRKPFDIVSAIRSSSLPEIEKEELANHGAAISEWLIQRGYIKTSSQGNVLYELTRPGTSARKNAEVDAILKFLIKKGTPYRPTLINYGLRQSYPYMQIQASLNELSRIGIIEESTSMGGHTLYSVRFHVQHELSELGNDDNFYLYYVGKSLPKETADGIHFHGSVTNAQINQGSRLEESPMIQSVTTTPKRKAAATTWYKSALFIYIIWPLLVLLLGAYIVYRNGWI